MHTHMKYILIQYHFLQVKIDKISKLKPAFKPNDPEGSVTGVFFCLCFLIFFNANFPRVEVIIIRLREKKNGKKEEIL